MSTEKRNRELVLDVVYNSDPEFEIKDNVYYIGSKAFVANSVVQWLTDKINNGDFMPESAEFYINAVNDYINGKINLRWEGDNLIIEGKKHV